MTPAPKKSKTIRLRLEKSTLTHLMCVRCGRFRAELAIVSPEPDVEPQAGLHKACAKAMHIKRGAAA